MAQASSRVRLNVVTGIIIHHKSIANGHVRDPRKMQMLLGKRAETKSNGGLWEHIGGKIESSDASMEHALTRELNEELGGTFKVDIKKFLFQSSYIPQHIERPIIDLNVFLVHHLEGHIRLTRAHQDCGWVDMEGLQHMMELDMLSPADHSIVEWLDKHKWNINDGL